MVAPFVRIVIKRQRALIVTYPIRCCFYVQLISYFGQALNSSSKRCDGSKTNTQPPTETLTLYSSSRNGTLHVQTLVQTLHAEKLRGK